MNEKAKQQWKAPIEWFKINVKCCFNCNHWNETLCAAEKEYAKKFSHNFCKRLSSLTAFDYYCADYDGNATEENLIIALTGEECKTLLAEGNEVGVEVDE